MFFQHANNTNASHAIFNNFTLNPDRELEEQMGRMEEWMADCMTGMEERMAEYMARVAEGMAEQMAQMERMADYMAQIAETAEQMKERIARMEGGMEEHMAWLGGTGTRWRRWLGLKGLGR